MALRFNRLRPIDRLKNVYDKAHDFFSHNVLLLLTLLSVFFGLLFGFFLRPLNLSQDTLNLINFPGEIFMQVLKMMILPLIFSSLISALAQMDAREAGQMGLTTVLYYLTTTVLATMLGIALVTAIHPGDPSVKEGILAMDTPDANVSPLDTFLDLVRNMFPENIIKATFQRVQTEYVTRKPLTIGRNISIALPPKKTISPAMGTNILGIIVFCTGFGIVISHLGEKARIVVDFFVILDAVIMRWVEALMWFAPLGIFCLISGNLLELDDLGDTAQMLFLYVVTITLGFLIHAVIITPLLYFVCTRKNPLFIVKGMLQALVTAFGTASGGAALPTSMQCLEENCGIDRRIARFVLPLGSTINMDGNALYEAVAVIFIAQLNNVELSFAEVITVSVTATVASIGLGSVPAGLVSILLILNTVGLPAKDVSLIITVDWLLDRIRTSVNVLGDGFAAGVVAHILKKRLDESDQKHEYRHEIKEEIEQLKSGAPSRKPSNFSGWSFSSRDFLGPLSQSRPISRRNSGILTWRLPFSAAPSDPSYTPLPKVENV